MARQANVASLDADPDEAAEAIDLSDVIGVPSTAIYGDVEGFKRNHKAALGSQIINDNEYIADYLNSHPMAPRVSHDDLGQLDEISRAFGPFKTATMIQDWLKSDSMAKSFEAGWGEQPFGQVVFQRPNDVEWALSYPEVASVFGAASMPIEALMRTTGGLLHMGRDGLASIFGDKFANEMAAMAEWGMMRGDIGVKAAGGPKDISLGNRALQEGLGREIGIPQPPPLPDTPEARATPTMKIGDLTIPFNDSTIRELGGAQRAIEIADIYSRADKEPPYGIHPLLDEAKKIQTKEDLDVLDDALRESQKSATRERAPDFFANFVRQHIGSREIGISADAVRKLYADKVPVADDGILGWVPDLDKKLAAAELTGDDIRIPASEWFAKVDPEVAKNLHDDIRARDGYPTLNETKIEAEPHEAIAEPLQTTRGSASLEPMFQVGDRKLTIEKRPPRQDKTGAILSDEFRMYDDTGTKVGWLEVIPYEGGKKLYVDNVGGFESLGYGPNSFGPALTRSLIKQLREHYPQMEQLGGFRISGAREKAGTTGEVWIKADAADGWDSIEGGLIDQFKDLMTQKWEMVNKNVSALFDEEGKGLAANSPLGQMVLSELRRLVPDVESDVAHHISLHNQPVHGVMIPNLRQIIVSLQNKDPIGTARHESIHALWNLGLITDKEWNTLHKAVETEGWLEKFNVESRWKDIPGARLPEEAIAEAFRTWANGAKAPPEVHTIFEKIKAFFENIRQKLGELLGHDLTWEQIFEKIDSGEIGRREPEVEGEGEPAAQPSDEGSGLFDRGKALGVTQTHLDRIEKLIAKRNAEDFEASRRRAEVRQRRKSNVEWKERRTQLMDEVRENLSARPDLALDKLFSDNKIKIDPATLSEEQRSRLPKDFIQKKDGVKPDDLAPYFGYTTGDALVERLAMLTEDRRRSGMSQRDYFNRLVDVETDRRLNAEFGDRGQTIIDEAKDQALSETQLKLTTEELLAYALKNGEEPKFNLDQVKDLVRQAFDQVPVGSINSDRLFQKMGSIGKKIEEAEAKGDWQTAYQLMQQRQFAQVSAKMAIDYERARRQFDRMAKTYGKNRTFPAVEQEYVNWIHDLLLRTGHRLSRSVQDLQENIARQSETNLSDFIDERERFYMGIRTLDVPDFLRDPDFRKNVDELTAYEFEGLRQALKILDKAGRDEKSVYVGGEKYDLAVTKSKFRQQLETFGYSALKALPENSRFRLLRGMAYGLTNMETLLNRWDRGSAGGMFNQVIIRPLVEAANGKSRLLRDIANDLKPIDRPGKDYLEKLVDAPFPDPMTPDGQGKWTGFNKGNVLMMLQNAGNKSNWNVLSRGFGAEPEALFKWLQKNVTREDVERAVGIGNIFKKLVGQSDKVYERLTGATVEKIPLQPVEFNFADGTSMKVDGWYHPLDRDPIRASMWSQDETGAPVRKGSRSRESAFDDADYFHASTSNGYTKKRTGVIYPVNLDFNMVPSRMRQMAHDIHFREPLLNIEKVFADRLFQEDVAKYYGREYAKGLMPYLRHLAGSEGVRSENAMWGEAFLEKARQNIISTYIGFNPFTIFKHGPTAFVMSSRQVGAPEFFKAMVELNKPGSSDLVKFVMDNSEELQRRERHWQDTMAGQGNELSDKSTIREQIIDWGSKGVAASDMFSARPTWWAAYKKARADGQTHGQSKFLAERAVRFAHGSTAETNLPPLVRSGGVANRYMTSVYGFFGTVMQRRIELAHQLNDIYQLGREGELKEAAKNMPELLRNFMAYVVWPTIVEEAVTGLTTEDKRGWGQHILAGATMGLSSSVLYVRDLMYGLTTGHDPGAGLISSAMHDAANFARDVRRGRDALSKEHAGKTVEDTLTLFGEVTGMFPKTAARGVRFGIDVATGQQKPKTPIEWMRGVAHGEVQRRKH